MGKKKLQRFKELETMERVFQPPFEEAFRKDHPLKGTWRNEVFRNNYPLVLELGCGKGEYTLGLARKYPERNFMGIDIKGARIWRGAKTAHEEGLNNVAFLRTRIELLYSFFERNEVNEIWITFPDPQEKRRRQKKRLTSSWFLNMYRELLAENGIIHLKTDNPLLYQYTVDILRYNNIEISRMTSDLYQSGWEEEILSLKTYYEKQFLMESKNIHYIEFSVPGNRTLKEPPGYYER